MKLVQSSILRYGLMTLGWLCVALAMLGVILPGLPTTIFVIIAAWAFSRSSARFHTWLYGHKTFGPLLKDWEDHRVVPRRAKTLMVILMTLSLAILTYFEHQRPWLPAGVAVILLAVAIYVLRCPSERPLDKAE